MTRELDHDVLMAAATAEAIGDAIRVESAGAHQLKGVGDPIELFAPVREEAPEPEAEPIMATAGRLRRGVGRRISERLSSRDGDG
jgi:class 3 adenylate cyclase